MINVKLLKNVSLMLSEHEKAMIKLNEALKQLNQQLNASTQSNSNKGSIGKDFISS